MLVLSGCQTSNYKKTGNWYGNNKASQVVIRLSDSKLCQMAIYKNSYGTKAWDINMYSMHDL